MKLLTLSHMFIQLSFRYWFISFLEFVRLLNWKLFKQCSNECWLKFSRQNLTAKLNISVLDNVFSFIFVWLELICSILYRAKMKPIDGFCFIKKKLMIDYLWVIGSLVVLKIVSKRRKLKSRCLYLLLNFVW